MNRRFSDITSKRVSQRARIGVGMNCTLFIHFGGAPDNNDNNNNKFDSDAKKQNSELIYGGL